MRPFFGRIFDLDFDDYILFMGTFVKFGLEGHIFACAEVDASTGYGAEIIRG